MNNNEAQRLLWVTTSCGFDVLRKKMRVAQPMRVKQKLYTNKNKETGSYNADHSYRCSDKQRPIKRKDPLMDSIPGINHGCRLSIYEVA